MEILKANKFDFALKKLNESNLSIRNNRNNTNNNIPRNIPPRRASTNSSLKSSSSEVNGNDVLPLVPEQFTPEKYIVEDSELRSKIDEYPMTKRSKGVLFLVNIHKFVCDVERERRGAHFDTTNLTDLFGKLDFKIFKYEDITKDQFQSLLTRLLDSEHCKQAQCFVLALMSHGQMIDRKNAYVTFYDNKQEEVHNILDNFSNKNCPTLIKKPKILFFPFCR